MNLLETLIALNEWVISSVRSYAIYKQSLVHLLDSFDKKFDFHQSEFNKLTVKNSSLNLAISLGNLMRQCLKMRIFKY